jgi:ABC-type uncharacterized transport system ATPase subunit
VLTTRDRVHGLQGLAGTGKTTTLEAIREGAERSATAIRPRWVIIRHCSTTPISRVFSRTCATRT